MAITGNWKIMALNVKSREYTRVSTEFAFYEDARKYFNEHFVKVTEDGSTTLIDNDFAVSLNGEYVYRIV